MNPTLLVISLALTVAIAISVSSLFVDWKMVQAQNTSLLENSDTRMVLDMKNNTITIVNTTTNETISVRNVTLNAGNATIDETVQNNQSNDEE